MSAVEFGYGGLTLAATLDAAGAVTLAPGHFARALEIARARARKRGEPFSATAVLATLHGAARRAAGAA